MIVKLRLEAEGKTLSEVIKDLQATALPKGIDKLHVHDEHYERVNETLFRGRVVLSNQRKPPQASVQWPNGISSSGAFVVNQNKSSTKAA